MDGAAFQGMPRIALTPAEEAQIPRPHSSASQVATAVPSAYSRTASPGRHLYHPYYSNPSAGSLAGFGSPSSSIPGDVGYSRSSSPGPRPSSPSPSSIIHNHHYHPYNTYPPNNHNSNNAPVEQEYPQNPQDSHAYYSQIPPRSSSPVPSRLAFSLTPRARSPSPQMYSNLHPSSYFHRPSYDYTHPRPGSPLQQEHQDSWDSIHKSPTPCTNSDESGDDSDDEQDDSTQPRRRRPEAKRNPSSKGILSRLKEKTSRLSFGDEVLRHQHQLHQQQQLQQEKEKRSSQDSDVIRRSSQDSSSSRRQKEVLHDLSDEEKQEEPRKSTSRWRPSLSLIRQESSSSNNGSQYLQNNPHRIGSNNDHGEDASSKKKKARKGKNGKRKRKGQKRTRKPRHDDPHLAYVNQGMYAPPVRDLSLPSLAQVLDKKTRYPLRYEDFEEFLRSQRAVEYLNFWAVSGSSLAC